MVAGVDAAGSRRAYLGRKLLTIWIDLANSPQVLFFRPVIGHLKEGGWDVLLTARDYAQTIPLIDRVGLSAQALGQYSGGSLFAQTRKLFSRALRLAQWARGMRIELAVSHNSYAQILAARLLGIPTITFMDYEHAPLNHLAFRLANLVVVPAVFPEEALRRFGAETKFKTYRGVKEMIYLSDFVPESDYKNAMGVSPEQRLVVFRPPAPWASYHKAEPGLFGEALNLLLRDPLNSVLVLPRTKSQREVLERWHHERIFLPGGEEVYDGAQLVYAAELVVSGGGTMAREAAVLGTPAVTVFQGKSAAVDTYLEGRGRLLKLPLLDRPGLEGAYSMTRQDPLRSRDLVESIVGIIDGQARGWKSAAHAGRAQG